MRRTPGLTLVELLISVLIASILILVVGSLSLVSQEAQQKSLTQQQIFNDVEVGLKFLRNRVHSSDTIFAENSTDPSWIGQRLMVGETTTGTGCFGVYEFSQEWVFMYLPNKDDLSIRQVILAVPRQSGNSLQVAFSVDSRAVHITLSGNKGRVPINYQTTIARRIIP